MSMSNPRADIALPHEVVERLRDIFPELPRYICALRLDVPGRTEEVTLEVKFLPTLTTADGAEVPTEPQTRTFRLVPMVEAVGT